MSATQKKHGAARRDGRKATGPRPQSATRTPPKQGTGNREQGTEQKRKAAAPKQKPVERGRGTRLDQGAALQMAAKGATLASIARAAGSRAKSRHGLQQVGYRLLKRLRERGEILETFQRHGYGLDEFCRGVIEQATGAMRVLRDHETGDELAQDIDFAARTAARGQFLDAIGVRKLPYEPQTDYGVTDALPTDVLLELLAEAEDATHGVDPGDPAGAAG